MKPSSPLLAIAAASCIAGCGSETPVAPSQQIRFDGPPIVVAHYMPWYETQSFSGRWRHWAVNEGHIPRRFWHYPEKTNRMGWRDIASVYYPIVGPYDSTDPDLCEYHILLAKASGIDGFVADWYGPDRPEEKAFSAMKRKSEELAFKVMICWEDQTLFPPYSAAQTREKAVEIAGTVVKFLEKNWFASPSYLRIADRPVLTNFAWNDPDATMQSKAFSAADWDRVFASLAARPVFIHDWHPHRKTNDFEPYESVMPWGSAFHMTDDNPKYWQEAEAAKGRGRYSFLSGTVLPGFDNRGVGGWGGQGAIGVTPRRDGRKHEATWANCLQHKPQFIQIATWNDFNEGAIVEPVRYGVANPAYPQEGFGYEELETIQRNVSKLKGSAFDAASLRVPAVLYYCRKIARAANDTAASAKIDAIRDKFLAGGFLAGPSNEAREEAEKLYMSYPAKLRQNKDLALYTEPAVLPKAGLPGWLKGWEVNECLWRFQENFAEEQNIPHPGRKNMLTMHPLSKDLPGRITRRVKVGRHTALSFHTSANIAHPNVSDFLLRVFVDGKVVLEEVISAGPAPTPNGWKHIKLSLAEYAGKEIELIIETGAGGKDPWNHEHAFLSDLIIR